MRHILFKFLILTFLFGSIVTMPDVQLFASENSTRLNALPLDLQGHRGARGLAPENTLSAFKKALEIGVTTLELDIGITADDVPIVSHNPFLEPDFTRGPDGKWLADEDNIIYSMDLKTLKTFDVGRIDPSTRYSSKYPEQVPADGQTIPTLLEVIELIKRMGNETVRLNIETKISPLKADMMADVKTFTNVLMALLGEQGFLDRVTIQSFDWRIVQEVQKRFPSVPTSYLSVKQSWYDTVSPDHSGRSPWAAGFKLSDFDGSLPKMIKAAGGKMWSVYFKELTPELVAEAHALGIFVKVWTVNDTGDMERLIDMGVDGIITDYPNRLRKIMSDRGMVLPVRSP